MRAGIVMLLLTAVTVTLWAGTRMKQPTPRDRAAYGMLLSLRDLQAARQNTPALSDGKCPKDISSVTWGVAKTDPWDHDFLLRCTGTTAVIGSAGADGKPGTADDLWSDQPLVKHAPPCKAACARAKACKATEVIDQYCAASCKTLSDDAVFYADTCLLLDGCEATTNCLYTAAEGKPGIASCDDFGRLAARAVRKPSTVKALTAECEQDALHFTELPCVAKSTSSADLVRCFLTVNRSNVEEILSR